MFQPEQAECVAVGGFVCVNEGMNCLFLYFVVGTL